MSNENSIGNIIYRLRSQKKMTQEELSFGLCSVGTISRIENGYQVPSGGLLRLLLEKLGEPGIFNFAYYADVSHKENGLRDKILESFENLDRKGFEESFDEYGKLFSDNNKKTKQFHEIIKYLYIETLGGMPENPEETLVSLLRVSQKDYQDTNDLTSGLDLSEMLILNSLALFYISKRQFKKSKAILEKLIQSLSDENKMVAFPKKTKAVFFHNLALSLVLEGDYYFASKVMEKAVEISKKEGGLVFRIKINTLKAFISETLGFREDAQDIYFRINLDYKELGIHPGKFWDSMGLLSRERGIVVFKN